jgi:hypothetical protein
MAAGGDHRTVKVAVQLANILCADEGRPGLRCVLDYKRVNSSSFSDRYALRTIEECLEMVGRAGSKVYLALDCRSAFWQLQLRPSDHSREGPVPLGDVSPGTDGRSSKLLEANGRT